MIGLEIKSKENTTYHFCKYLLRKLRSLILYQCIKNRKKLIKYDNYIKENNIIKPIIKGTKIPNIRTILIASISHFKISKTLDSYILRLDNNAIIPTTYAKFIDIIKLVNKGTLDLPRCPIYDKAFNNIKNNLISYYEDWVEGSD